MNVWRCALGLSSYHLGLTSRMRGWQNLLVAYVSCFRWVSCQTKAFFLFIKRWQRIQTLPLAQLKLSWDTVLKSQAVFSPCGIQLWFSLPELWGHASGRLDRRLHPGGSSSDETFHSRVERLSGTGCGCSPLEESLASQYVFLFDQSTCWQQTNQPSRFHAMFWTAHAGPAGVVGLVQGLKNMYNWMMHTPEKPVMEA